MSGINTHSPRSGPVDPTAARVSPAQTTPASGVAPAPNVAAPKASDGMQLQTGPRTTLGLNSTIRTPAQQRYDAIKDQIRTELDKLPDAKDTAELLTIQESVNDLQRLLPERERNNLGPSQPDPPYGVAAPKPKPTYDQRELAMDAASIKALMDAEVAKVNSTTPMADLLKIQERVEDLKRLFDLKRLND